MPDLEKRDVKERINEEIRWCFTYEKDRACQGACGRKLRRVCVWCPNYRKGDKEENEKDH